MAQYSGSAANLGLGLGGLERVAGYPANLWLLVIGVLAVRGATFRAAAEPDQTRVETTRQHHGL